jgi:hypothetical protein
MGGQKPRSTTLEATVALITLYFGFFGILRLGAHVDVALILCALYFLVRLESDWAHERHFGKKSKGLRKK